MRKYTPEELRAKHDALIAYLDVHREDATVQGITRAGHLGAVHRNYGTLNAAKRALGMRPRVGKGYQKERVEQEVVNFQSYKEAELSTQEELRRLLELQ